MGTRLELAHADRNSLLDGRVCAQRHGSVLSMATLNMYMPAFVVVLLALWCCSIAADNVGPAEEGCECLDYDNIQDSHCDASEL